MATATIEKHTLTKKKCAVNAIKNKRPRGYLTHGEFWNIAKQDLDTMCVEYGILQ
ncbi:MAG: hypothetical protein FWC39_02900 [Bacteroidetes bacterium]|nr:hypothetical protein [Bacteroidota bacterium]